MAIELRVNSLYDDVCTVAAERSWKVREVKSAIEKDVGVPVLGQQLIWDTVELVDAEVLDAVLPPTEIVQLVLIRRSLAQISRLQNLTHLESCYREDSEQIIKDLEFDQDLAVTGLRLGLLSLETIATLASNMEWNLYASPATMNLMNQILSDREVIMAAMNQNGMDLRHVQGALRNDRDVTMAAVSQNGLALALAPMEHRCDREVVKAAVRQCRSAIECACGGLQSDVELRYCID
jgi:hypothetical protein